MNISQDTIIAQATPPGRGAVALLRLSGPGALQHLECLWRGRSLAELKPRQATLGKLVAADDRVLDEVLLTFFPGPHSYTGEDVVEIACHGGQYVTQALLQVLLATGLRLAGPGEFTQRAFLNGKLDLTQAEAVMDLIAAQTDLALRSAQQQLSGGLGERIVELRQALLHNLAHVEAHIDFPEEEIAPDTNAQICGRLASVGAQIRQLLATAHQGRILREGARVVLYGVPNAGKSSLLNALLGSDRAIVSPVAGTTRDTIEEMVTIGGYPVRLIDTAGLRESEDAVEQAGVNRTRAQLEQADLLLEVVDASVPENARLEVPEGSTPHRLLILNKTDLGLAAHWQPLLADADVCALSCETGQGLETLVAAMERILAAGASGAGESSVVAVNARHQACLERASASLAAGISGLEGGIEPEFVSLDLRAALDALGEIVGKIDTEDLLGSIFSQFCIGK